MLYNVIGITINSAPLAYPNVACVVTAYVDIPEHETWWKHFLNLQDPMIVFTTTEFVEQIRRIRGDRPIYIVEITLAELDLGYSSTFWEAQLQMDPKKRVWLNKPYFVGRAIALNPFNARIFAWSDIGSFRVDTYDNEMWLQYLHLVPPNAILFQSWRKMPKLPWWHRMWLWFSPLAGSKLQLPDYSIICGDTMVGTATTWDSFNRAFNMMLDVYVSRNNFIGDDQRALQGMCETFPNLCVFATPGLHQVLHDGSGDAKDLFVLNRPHRTEFNYRAQSVRCLNSDFHPNHSTSVWTMLTSPGYTEGAMRLGKSVLRHTSTPLDLVLAVLESKPLLGETWSRLRAVGWQRCVVKRIAPKKAPLPRFKDQFTKLHLWGMTSYDTLLYLDSDTLVVGSIDELLHKKLKKTQIGVSRDFWTGTWSDTFNMGVFLIHPDADQYTRLINIQSNDMINYDNIMAEQGFLNEIYRHKWHDNGFAYNANLAIFSQDRSYWDKHESEIRIVHYTMSKPWVCTEEYKRPCEWWSTST